MASQDVVDRDRADPLNVSGLGDNGDFSQAIEHLSDALNLNPNNVTLYSNRAAAYMRVSKYAEALDDANRALALKPDWTKVSRRGGEGRGREGRGREGLELSERVGAAVNKSREMKIKIDREKERGREGEKVDRNVLIGGYCGPLVALTPASCTAHNLISTGTPCMVLGNTGSCTLIGCD